MGVWKYTHTYRDMLTQTHMQAKAELHHMSKNDQRNDFKSKHWLQLISSLSVLLGKQVMEMLWCLGFRTFLVSFCVFWLLFFFPLVPFLTAL